MYESYFGFVNRPFIASPSLERYFPATAIEQTVQTANRVIARAEGPMAIFGGSGLGKSISCLRIAEQFRRSFDVVMLSSSALMTRRALLQSLLFELKMPYRDLSEGELRLSLVQRLQPNPDIPTDGLLLMVDEAQVLPFKLLDEIRLLTNLQRNGLPRVRLVLCGNLQLEETLCHPQMDSLNQRLAARCYLTPLSREETARYVMHKIELCGVNYQRVITQDALDALHRGSDGIPRLIDQLADQSMLIAAQDRICPVDASVVGRAWGMLQQLPNPWCDPESLTGNSSRPESLAGNASSSEPSLDDLASDEDESEDWAEQPASSQQPALKSNVPVPTSGIIEFGNLDDNEDLFEEEHFDAPSAIEETAAETSREIVGSSKVDSQSVFGDNFDEEFEIPLQSRGDFGGFTGIAFGQLNHDLESFPNRDHSPRDNAIRGDSIRGDSIRGTPAQFTLEEAEEFIDYPFTAPGVSESLHEYEVAGEEAEEQGEMPQPDFSRSIQLHVDDPASLESISLESMVEEEMRELVSELNLSAMAFDPTQIIVELEPNELQLGETGAIGDETSFLGRRSSAAMRNEWNEGNALADSSRAIASDDRDMLVIEEDEAEKPQIKNIIEPASGLPQPVLHPYAKLFSNLRKS